MPLIKIKKKNQIKNPHCETRYFRDELNEHFGVDYSRGKLIQHLIKTGDLSMPEGINLSRKQIIRLVRMVAHAALTEEQLGRPPSKQKTIKKKKSAKKKTRKAHKANSEDFLTSWAWRTLRYEILQKFGRRCMCCGACPDDLVTVICVDHIKPRHTHPDLCLDADNLQVLCAVCNQGKGAWDETDFRGATTEYDFQCTLATEARKLQ